MFDEHRGMLMLTRERVSFFSPGPASADELKEHMDRERLKAPSCLRVTPMWFSSGKSITVRMHSRQLTQQQRFSFSSLRLPHRIHPLRYPLSCMSHVVPCHPYTVLCTSSNEVAQRVAHSQLKHRR